MRFSSRSPESRRQQDFSRIMPRILARDPPESVESGTYTSVLFGDRRSEVYGGLSMFARARNLRICLVSAVAAMAVPAWAVDPRVVAFGT